MHSSTSSAFASWMGCEMRFVVIINHKRCTGPLSYAEAKRAATWFSNRVRGVVVSVGLL